jgi:hypothetical protein
VGIFKRALGGLVEYGQNRCSPATFLEARERERDIPLEYNLAGIRILRGKSNNKYLEQRTRHTL